ncbi:MAG: DUF5996 family protein [Acidobacteriota bacterium]
MEKLPELPLKEWKDTLDTLHMWTQVAGKIALATTPLINHYWNATMRVTPRGLLTKPLNVRGRAFDLAFDLVDHRFIIRIDDGSESSISLEPMAVADFYHEVMKKLENFGLEINIWPMPVEFEDPIRFTEDRTHKSYDREYIERFRSILQWTDQVFKEFRSEFVGKASPVHFFWGSFDLATTRFDGERAPKRKDADPVTQEAYSHACISHGFWCGGEAVSEPAYYAYAAPEPDGLNNAAIGSAEAYYHAGMKEFILPYDAVRRSQDPKGYLGDFLRLTYAEAADRAGWDRDKLERR